MCKNFLFTHVDCLAACAHELFSITPLNLFTNFFRLKCKNVMKPKREKKKDHSYKEETLTQLELLVHYSQFVSICVCTVHHTRKTYGRYIVSAYSVEAFLLPSKTEKKCCQIQKERCEREISVVKRDSLSYYIRGFHSGFMCDRMNTLTNVFNIHRPSHVKYTDRPIQTRQLSLLSVCNLFEMFRVYFLRLVYRFQSDYGLLLIFI